MRLDDVFDDIIFERNLRWGIKELGRDIKTQIAFDYTAKILEHYFNKSAPLWDVRRMKRWGSSPASDKQKDLSRTEILDHHIIQDFKSGEVTPEQAHRIGM